MQLDGYLLWLVDCLTEDDILVALSKSDSSPKVKIFGPNKHRPKNGLDGCRITIADGKSIDFGFIDSYFLTLHKVRRCNAKLQLFSMADNVTKFKNYLKGRAGEHVGANSVWNSKQLKNIPKFVESLTENEQVEYILYILAPNTNNSTKKTKKNTKNKGLF